MMLLTARSLRWEISLAGIVLIRIFSARICILVVMYMKVVYVSLEQILKLLYNCSTINNKHISFFVE